MACLVRSERRKRGACVHDRRGARGARQRQARKQDRADAGIFLRASQVPCHEALDCGLRHELAAVQQDDLRLSDSYEQYYQAVRRCWRFGQKKPVDVYIVISAREGCVKQNIERKQADCEKMRRAMLEQSREITKKELQSTCRIAMVYDPKSAMHLPDWREFRNECA